MMPINCSSFILSLGILDYIDVRNTSSILVLQLVVIKIPAHRRLVQLSLFHSLGTMSHRVNEGGPKTKQSKYIRVPERESGISESTESGHENANPEVSKPAESSSI